MQRSARICVVACALACVAAGRVDAAEGESALSLHPAYARFTVAQKDAEGRPVDRGGQGGVLLVDYERGLSDALALRATIGGGAHAAAEGTALTASATAGIVYAIDVLRYVPTLTLGLGALGVRGGGLDPDVKLLVELGAGLDVLESPRWSWGVAARFDWFYSQATTFTIGPRVSWRWGFF